MISIIDQRVEKDLTHISFSGYKKNDVIKKYINSCLSNQKEEAFYWSAELVCAGHFRELWDAIFKIMYTYIYTSHVRLPVYINLRLNEFRKIINDSSNNLSLRNNESIRLLFIEISIVICESPKRHLLRPIKVSRDDLHISRMSHKMGAKNVNYIKNEFKEDDPSEIFIALNEFTYNITNTKSYHDACYWLEWILLYEKKTTKSNKLLCTKRPIVECTEKYSQDFIWIIWTLVLNESSKQNVISKRIVESLLHIFSLRYTSSVKSRRKLLIYFAIMIVCESFDDNNSLSVNTDTKTMNMYMMKIYKQIAKSVEDKNIQI